MNRFSSSTQREQDAETNISFDDLNADGSNMYQRYTRVDVNTLDYLNSEHAMAMQNSRYVQIENNRERIRKQ